VRVRRIEHLGLACRSAEAAAAFYSGALGLPVVARETLAAMKLKVVKVRAGESVLELLEPLEGEAVISKFLDSRGEGIHHVCFEVPNLAEALLHLEIEGIELIDTAPRRGAEGPVAFIHPRSCHGVLVELIEAPDGPAWTSLRMTPA
jgi:methylmalonyl-CoA epimerase